MRKLFFQMIICVLTMTAYSQTTATYDIVFTSNWEAHGALPNNAHFTNLVGATHNDNVTFLEMGGIATPGVELVAELGINGQFSNEVTNAINAGNADQYINGPNLFFNGSGRTITISDLQVDADHPLVTLISMIAPSPDWIVAANSISLLDENNQWIPVITMDLFPYDAGTEEGNAYSLNNPATNPKEPISSRRGITPFNSQRMGTLVLTRKNIPDPTCDDGIQNGDETGIDCGGSCTPCEVPVQGGQVATSDNQTEVTTISGDGIADVITFSTSSTATASYTYIITDSNGGILTTKTSSHDFESAPAGTCRVYGISYNGDLDVTDKNISDTGLATGSYDLSDNWITVIREAVVPTCNDGIQNGDETGVDCGGSCEPCNTDMYCDSNANNASEEYVRNVKLGTIDNTTEGSTGGYGDYTSLSTELPKGVSNTMTITPFWRSTVYREGYSVWIDYNKDGDFMDNGEQIWTKDPSRDDIVSFDFRVPEDAMNGNTRMRISMKYNGIPTACESFRYGEVEDYTVIISDGSDPVPSCTDGIQNGNETGVDCGGSCAPCDTNDDSVVYVDIIDETVDQTTIWSPFQIEVGDSRYFGPWLSGNTLRLVTYNKDIVSEGVTNNVTLIEEGTQVGASSNFTANNSFIVSSPTFTNWNGASGYIGFNFKISGETHYGWLYVTVSDNGMSYTIHDYAYNTKAGESLITKRPRRIKSRDISELTAYPNPFKDTATVNVSGVRGSAITIKVYDLLGKELFVKTYSKNPGNVIIGEQLRLSGTYFVKMITNNESRTLQLIKE